MEAFIGTIVLHAGTFCPSGWAICDGSSININQHQALFSLIGFTYGGSGSSFRLPDLRGRVPVGTGTSVTGTPYSLGTSSGTENNTLQSAQLPPHNHPVVGTTVPVSGTLSATMKVNNTSGTETNPLGNYLGVDTSSGAGVTLYSKTADGNTLAPDAIQLNGSGLSINLNGTSTGNTGAGTPINNMQPFQVINYIICLNGLYPSRD